MKFYIRWAVVIIVLISILGTRIVLKYYRVKTKKVFLSKEVTLLGFNDTQKRNIEIKKEETKWIVCVSTDLSEKKFCFPGNKEKIDSLISEIKNVELTDIVTKSTAVYTNLSLDEETGLKITAGIAQTKNKVIYRTVFLGKEGGFSYNEFYLRFDDKPEVYLAKNFNKWKFQEPFFNYCDRKIISCDTDKIIEFKIYNRKKTVSFKKEEIFEPDKSPEVKWINLSTKRTIELQKIENYLSQFKELVADSIILLEQKLNEVGKIELSFHPTGKIEILLFEKLSVPEGEFYPIKVVELLPSEHIKYLSLQDEIFGIDEHKLNNLKSFQE